MPYVRAYTATVEKTRRWPRLYRWGASAGIVGATIAARSSLDSLFGGNFLFVTYFPSAVICTSLFGLPCGMAATVAFATAASWLHFPHVGVPRADETARTIALSAFVVLCALNNAIIETLHRAIDRMREAERLRTVMLREFRHRTRNDLNALVGLLLLRGRAAASDTVRDAMREGAQHALALARVHTRLTAAEPDAKDRPVIGTRHFLEGLTGDLASQQSGEGSATAALVVDAEEHPIGTERAVPLGMFLNEVVNSAIREAFPDGRSGVVRVRFRRDGDLFVLAVEDDGVGLPQGAEMDAGEARTRRGAPLGERILRGLAAQLRGTCRREPVHGGTGTLVELRFPVRAPDSASA